MDISGDDSALSLRSRLQDHVESAIRALERDPPTDESVHSARKALKQARAILRLLRPGLERSVFVRDNRALRDVGRALSARRDDAVLAVTLDRLLERCRSVNPSAWPDAAGRRLRAVMAASSPPMEETPTLPAARSMLSLIAGRWRDPGFPADDSDGWHKGLKRIYTDGREGLQCAQQERSDEHLHEWRRHAKYLWHALQAVEPLYPAGAGAVIGELADQAHRLSDYLGDDHDLAVLGERLTTRPLPDDEFRSALLAVLDDGRQQLQGKAFLIGHRIYADKPGAFVKRLESGRPD